MIPKILKGNDFTLTITVNDKSEDIAYSLSNCDNIIINIIGANKQRWKLTGYTINGNVITGSVQGSLPCQVYSTEILIYKDSVHYRSYQLGQFAIVNTASQAGLASNVEFDTDKVIDIYCEFGNGLSSVNDVSARTKHYYNTLSANVNNVSIYAADTSSRVNDISVNIDNYIESNNAYTIDTSARLYNTSNNVDNYIRFNNTYNNNVSTRLYNTSVNIDNYIKTNNAYTSNTSTRVNDISTYIDNYIINNNTMSADTSIVISDISTRIQKMGVDVSLNSHNNNILLDHYEQYDDDVQDISTRIIAAEKNIKIENTSISDISTRLSNLNTSSNTLFDNIYIGTGKKSIKIGDATTASGEAAIAIGNQSQAIGKVSFAAGNLSIAKADISYALGNIVTASNVGETALGNFNISHKNSDKLNDAKNTLLSVGNGTDDNHHHNAIEIMQDGSIYAQGITAPLQIYIKDISTRLSTVSAGGNTGGSTSGVSQSYVDDISTRLSDNINNLSAVNTSINDISTRLSKVSVSGGSTSGVSQTYVDDISTRLSTDINNLSAVNTSINDISTRLSDKLNKSDYVVADVNKAYVDSQLSTKQAVGNYATAEDINVVNTSISDISTRLNDDINNLSAVNTSINDISTRLNNKLDKSSYVAADVTKSYVDTQLATKQASGNYATATDINVVNTSISDISTRLSKVSVSGGSTYTAGSDISINNNVISYSLADRITKGTGSNSLILNYKNNVASADYSNSEGYNTTASGEYSHAEGQNTTASGLSSHAEGQNTTASKDLSHAEGSSTKAIGNFTHAEGESTTASGYGAHAEGQNTTASGEYSHAEGTYSTASGKYSHAEGSWTKASGENAHAEGNETIAQNYSEHAAGQYNVSHSTDTEKFGLSGNTLFSVGYGYFDSNNGPIRKNALEIMQDGSIYIAGLSTPLYNYISQLSGGSTAAFNGGTVTGATNFTYSSSGTKNTTISASGNIIAGDSSTTSYSIIGATRQCTSDSNRVNTAAFFTNSDGRAKFTHKGGAFSDTDDAYLCFSQDGFKVAYSGTYGTKPTEEYDIISSKGGQTINGTLTCTTLTQTSDSRLKDNIISIDNTDIEKVSNINLKSFNFKSDTDKVKKYGVIAQDLQSAGLSDLVTKNGDYLSVDYTSFLILKIAELEKRLDDLESNKYNDWNDLSRS